MLILRDLTTLGDIRKWWSAISLVPDAHQNWWKMAVTRPRHLLREVQCTVAIHSFLASPCIQARSRSGEIVRMDPPRRASRYISLHGKMRSLHPDAYGVLRRGKDT